MKGQQVEGERTACSDEPASLPPLALSSALCPLPLTGDPGQRRVRHCHTSKYAVFPASTYASLNAARIASG